MNRRTVLIDSVYINTGGGKVLLELLMDRLVVCDKERIVFLLDKRLSTPKIEKYMPDQIFFLESTERARKEFYKNHLKGISCIICFANVPPPIEVANRSVYIYFHAPILAKIHGSGMILLRKKLDYFLKRLYIRIKARDHYKWIVQTPSMKSLVFDKLRVLNENISVIPFYDENRIASFNSRVPSNDNKFLYVSDGSPHKNHLVLLNAWELINQINGNLELHLTVASNFTDVNSEILRLKSKGVNIINHGYCNAQEINTLYKGCNSIIFPSLAESFGLPLLEGFKAGCAILASDLVYVYDIVKPSLVFDPYNTDEIVSTVIYAFEHISELKSELVIENRMDAFLELLTAK